MSGAVNGAPRSAEERARQLFYQANDMESKLHNLCLMAGIASTLSEKVFDSDMMEGDVSILILALRSEVDQLQFMIIETRRHAQMFRDEFVGTAFDE